MRTYKIHLIRHGLTKGNLEGLYVGHTDLPLCDQGKAQLLEMKNTLVFPQPSTVFVSPLKRCKETAEILFENTTAVEIDGLIEYNFGSFEGRGADELHEKEPLFDRWLAGEENVAPPFGESNEEFAARVCNTFVRIVDGALKTKTDDICIITHGGVMMALLSVFGIPEYPAHEWLMPSGCGYTLRVTPMLWMSQRKVEVIKELPYPADEPQGNYYDGWDYYPE